MVEKLFLLTCLQIKSIDDKRDYQVVNAALKATKFSLDETKVIWKLLASILHLVRFHFIYFILSYLNTKPYQVRKEKNKTVQISIYIYLYKILSLLAFLGIVLREGC